MVSDLPRLELKAVVHYQTGTLGTTLRSMQEQRVLSTLVKTSRPRAGLPPQGEKAGGDVGHLLPCLLTLGMSIRHVDTRQREASNRNQHPTPPRELCPAGMSKRTERQRPRDQRGLVPPLPAACGGRGGEGDGKINTGPGEKMDFNLRCIYSKGNISGGGRASS